MLWIFFIFGGKTSCFFKRINEILDSRRAAAVKNKGDYIFIKMF